MNIEEAIIYEDKDILVLKKPAGLAVQTKRISEPDLESLLRGYLAGKGEEPYIGIIHRLDQPVEGVLVFAKTREAAAGLNRQIQQNKFQKYYYAVVWNGPFEERGSLTDYIRKDGRTNTSAVCGRDEKGAKRASLSYEVVERVVVENKTRALMRICLESGRHHQIRVQMAHAGCPLVGDYKYGTVESESKKSEGIALCAYRLVFAHPRTGEKHDYAIEPTGSAFRVFMKNKEILGT